MVKEDKTALSASEENRTNSKSMAYFINYLDTPKNE